MAAYREVEVEAASPVVVAASPVVEAACPVVEAASPVEVEAAYPVAEAACPAAEAASPVASEVFRAAGSTRLRWSWVETRCPHHTRRSPSRRTREQRPRERDSS